MLANIECHWFCKKLKVFYIYIINDIVKGAPSDFCQTMLIFESTIKNTPIPQQDLALILKSPPHMYYTTMATTIAETSEDDTNIFKHMQHRLVVWNEAKSRYSPIKKNQLNLSIRFDPFPLLEFSSPLASGSDIYEIPTPCLIITLLFNVFFLWYFPLFFCHLSLSSQSANIRYYKKNTKQNIV